MIIIGFADDDTEDAPVLTILDATRQQVVAALVHLDPCAGIPAALLRPVTNPDDIARLMEATSSLLGAASQPRCDCTPHITPAMVGAVTVSWLRTLHTALTGILGSTCTPMTIDRAASTARLCAWICADGVETTLGAWA